MDFYSRVKIFVFSHFTVPINTYSTRVSSIHNNQEILGHPIISFMTSVKQYLELSFFLNFKFHSIFLISFQEGGCDLTTIIFPSILLQASAIYCVKPHNFYFVGFYLKGFTKDSIFLLFQKFRTFCMINSNFLRDINEDILSPT